MFPTLTDADIVIGVLLLLMGALLGTLGYAATVGRGQHRRITDLVEGLADFADPRDRPADQRLDDHRLQAGFDRLARRVAETWTLATTDPLTDIPNRQAIVSRLRFEIDRATRYQRSLSVVLIDIDHFKRLNDTHGHAAGDRMLHELAQGLQGSLRSVDSVGRYGGEEFMIVLPETDVDDAASIAEKLRRMVARMEVKLPDGTPVQAAISAGVAGGMGADVRLDTLIRDADAALYSAKALGRNQVYVFREVEDERLVRRASIAPLAREQAMEVGRVAMAAAIDSLVSVLEARPPWSGKPSTLIADLSMTMAASLGLPDGEVDRIRTASLLHDLGKLAIPDEILAKPGDLNEPEWRVVTEHPKVGQIVLEQAGALRDAATIVLHHHEWYDGRGYPYGLSGEEIPVGARIVAVADAYEAMIAGRPYRAAVSHEAAIVELQRHAGVQFDPGIVSVFVALFGDSVPADEAARAEVGLPPARTYDHGRLHDALHARRRGAVPVEHHHEGDDADSPAHREVRSTGTEG